MTALLPSISADGTDAFCPLCGTDLRVLETSVVTKQLYVIGMRLDAYGEAVADETVDTQVVWTGPGERGPFLECPAIGCGYEKPIDITNSFAA